MALPRLGMNLTDLPESDNEPRGLLYFFILVGPVSPPPPHVARVFPTRAASAGSAAPSRHAVLIETMAQREPEPAAPGLPPARGRSVAR
jgi:hypothetical protein